MSFPAINYFSSPEKKLLQLLIIRLNGDQLSDAEYCEKMLSHAQSGIGGFIIFGGELEAVRLFIKILQAASPIPLFIASDIERGTAQQLIGTSPMSSQMAVASAIKGRGQKALELLRVSLKSLCTEAAYAGINMPLVPVADVNSDPDNPIICTRAFSDDPLLCAELCAEYVKHIEANKLVSCPKHFPGHGATSVDSHLSLPVINRTMQQMLETELIPFKAALDAGARSIMVGHLLAPAFDDKPATLSGAVVRYIRDAIGFNGLIMTDALNMSALKDYGSIHVKCLNAGMDILLHPDDPDAAIMELEAALKSGELDSNRLEESFNRIIAIKSQLNIQDAYRPDFSSGLQAAKSLAQLSFALLNGAWPKDISGWHVALVGDEDGISKRVFGRYFKNISSIEQADHLSENVIIAILTKVAAWRGLSGIDEETLKKINMLLKSAKRSAVVSFGSPYVLAGIKGAGALAAAYGYDEWIQEQFVHHIFEGTEFCGKLPVNIPIQEAQG